MPKLRDVLPSEASGPEYMNDRFRKYLDEEVVAEFGLGDDDVWQTWPGTHRNVMNWFRLANGKAVGWNESPSRGWAFPVVTMKD